MSQGLSNQTYVHKVENAISRKFSNEKEEEENNSCRHFVLFYVLVGPSATNYEIQGN